MKETPSNPGGSATKVLVPDTTDHFERFCRVYASTGQGYFSGTRPTQLQAGGFMLCIQCCWTVQKLIIHNQMPRTGKSCF